MNNQKHEYNIIFPDIERKIKNEIENIKINLIEDVEKRIDKTMESEYNYILEGDNYYSLCVLSATHKGMIDFIYIDPPYNTGNMDFKYNDKFVDPNDPWRHSKWLEFMHKRLFLARELLKDDGVIFISIDDNEQAPLKLLCDEVFGEENFIECFIWEKNTNPTYLNQITRKNVEYILCYQKLEKVKLVADIKVDFEDAPLINKDNRKSILTFPKGTVKFKKIRNGTFKVGDENGDTKLLNDIIVENSKNKNDFELEGQFRWSQTTLDENLKEGTVVIIKSEKMSPRVDYPHGKVTEVPPLKTINSSQNVKTNLESSSLLRTIGLEKGFNYAKPVSLIKYLIKLKNNTNILVLDFFAGTGTTGHAVLELNKEDNGNRKFILCTNNENNICTDICYPRIRKVIEGGYPGNPKGIPANLIYQRVEASKEKMTKAKATLDVNKDKVAEELIEVIKSKEETQVELKTYGKNKNLKIFRNNKNTKRCFICIGFDSKFMPDVLEKIIKKELKNKLEDIFYLPDEFVTDLEIERVPFPEKIVNSDNYIFGEREIERCI